MNNETLKLILGFLFSFLGGGVIVAIFEAIRINKAEKLSRRLEILNNQIRSLYGPLYFFTSQNARCFELADSIQKAYQREYVEQKFSQNPRTQENVKRDVNTTLEIGNTYAGLITQNNERIIEILRDNYSFIDPDDQDVFQQFVLDFNRLRTEREESGKLKTPLQIYAYIGDISFMRADFIERVKTKFNAKKTEIDNLNR
jgi:hypothetical protein